MGIFRFLQQQPCDLQFLWDVPMMLAKLNYGKWKWFTKQKQYKGLVRKAVFIFLLFENEKRCQGKTVCMRESWRQHSMPSCKQCEYRWSLVWWRRTSLSSWCKPLNSRYPKWCCGLRYRACLLRACYMCRIEAYNPESWLRFCILAGSWSTRKGVKVYVTVASDLLIMKTGLPGEEEVALQEALRLMLKVMGKKLDLAALVCPIATVFW